MAIVFGKKTMICFFFRTGEEKVHCALAFFLTMLMDGAFLEGKESIFNFFFSLAC